MLCIILPYITENVHIFNRAYYSICTDKLKAIYIYNDYIALVGSVTDNCEATNGIIKPETGTRFAYRRYIKMTPVI